MVIELGEGDVAVRCDDELGADQPVGAVVPRASGGAVLLV